VDGVVNSHQFWRDRAAGLPVVTIPKVSMDARLVSKVDRLCVEAGASIVVSSTWRLLYKLPRLREILRAHGITVPIIGRTPEIPGKERGVEIHHWLSTSGQHVTGMVILDDDSDMAHLLPWHVKTYFDTGITESDVMRAASVIARPMPAVTGKAAAR